MDSFTLKQRLLVKQSLPGDRVSCVFQDVFNILLAKADSLCLSDDYELFGSTVKQLREKKFTLDELRQTYDVIFPLKQQELADCPHLGGLALGVKAAPVFMKLIEELMAVETVSTQS